MIPFVCAQFAVRTLAGSVPKKIVAAAMAANRQPRVGSRIAALVLT